MRCRMAAHSTWAGSRLPMKRANAGWRQPLIAVRASRIFLSGCPREGDPASGHGLDCADERRVRCRSSCGCSGRLRSVTIFARKRRSHGPRVTSSGILGPPPGIASKTQRRLLQKLRRHRQIDLRAFQIGMAEVVESTGTPLPPLPDVQAVGCDRELCRIVRGICRPPAVPWTPAIRRSASNAA